MAPDQISEAVVIEILGEAAADRGAEGRRDARVRGHRDAAGDLAIRTCAAPAAERGPESLHGGHGVGAALRYVDCAIRAAIDTRREAHDAARTGAPCRHRQVLRR